MKNFNIKWEWLDVRTDEALPFLDRLLRLATAKSDFENPQLLRGVELTQASMVKLRADTYKLAITITGYDMEFVVLDKSSSIEMSPDDRTGQVSKFFGHSDPKAFFTAWFQQLFELEYAVVNSFMRPEVPSDI